MSKGFYINLDSRKDRRDHFENLKKEFPFLENIERMSAIENNDGLLGCCFSHIKALTQCLEIDAPYISIFEDDFTVLDDNVFCRFMDDFEKIKLDDTWKVIVLTPRGSTVPNEDIAQFKRIIDHQTATGYIVKREIIQILIDTLKESAKLQMQGVEKNISANDQYWKRIQLMYPFYYYKDIFAGQLIGWSNIEKRYVDYNDRFIKQNLF
jgi:GR25 family glycosyltransferase involved in LPS biosynthesis